MPGDDPTPAGGRGSDGMGEQSREAYRDEWEALDVVDDPVVEYEFEAGGTVVRRVNDAFVETFGVSADDAAGSSLDSLLSGASDGDYPECRPGRFDGTVSRGTTEGPRDFSLHVVPLDRVERNGQTAVYGEVSTGREYDRKVEALHESTRRLITQDSKDDVARTAVDAAVEILGLMATSVHFVDRDAEVLPPAATTDHTRELLGEPPTLPIDGSLAGDAFASGDPVVYESPSEYPGVYNPDTPLESEVILPLGDHGVLISGSTEPSAFSDTDVSLITILADNTAAALDRIERELALARRERELTRQNERLETFANMVSHDLRNPLNVAQGHLDLARSNGDQSHLDTVESAHDRMERLIADLLELARQGRELGDLERVSIGNVAEDAWAQVDTGTATLSVAESVGTVEADRSRLAACFENLFRNAIEHAGANDDPGDEHSGVSVRVGSTDRGFYVSDDGPGVPPEKRDDVFEAGYTDRKRGTGMGLAIVEEAAEAHGWDVSITDGIDGGARFEFAVDE